MQTQCVITIARQYGSGGREVGRKLAEKFGIPFYDRELIARAARESGISEEVFAQSDEKASSSLLYSLMMANVTFGNGVPMVNNLPMSDRLFILQANLIRKFADEGPCVIVGRCADDVLSGEKNVLNVYVYADKLSRMDRIVCSYGEKEGDAAVSLVRHDKQRAEYYNFYTGKSWGSAENFHLCVSTSALGLDGAVELIARAAELRTGRNDEVTPQ